MLVFIGDRRRVAAVAFVDWAIFAGKPIKAVREQMIAAHIRQPALLESMVVGLPGVRATR